MNYIKQKTAKDFERDFMEQGPNDFGRVPFLTLEMGLESVDEYLGLEKVYSEMELGCLMCGIVLGYKSESFCSNDCRKTFYEINSF